MKKCKKIARMVLLTMTLSIFNDLTGQNNIISNPGFELGTIPTASNQVNYATGWSNNCGVHYCSNCPPSYTAAGTPDLFDGRSIHSCYDFTNIWGTLNERTGQNRYVGFTQGGWSNNTYYYGETVEGTITQALVASCTYTVSFYAAAIQGYALNGCGTPSTISPDPTYNKIEVVLRKDNICSSGKVVYTSSNITATAWTKYSGTFSLTSQDVTAGYNKIEFRMVSYPNGYNGNSYSHALYLDDVSLIQDAPLISSDFGLTGTIPQGNFTTYIVTATVASVPSGSGFWWRVSEIDGSGNDVAGTIMENPSNWWSPSLYYTNTFPGYCCNSSITTGNGTFYQGKTYRVIRGTWGPCTPWASTSKTIFMCTGCRANGEPIFIVKDDPYYKVDQKTIAKAMAETNLNRNLNIDGKTADISVYPNPSNGTFNIDLSNINNVLEVEVYDNIGKLVFSKKSILPNDIIDLSNEPKGIYLIKVNTPEKFILQKIVLQ